MIDEALKFLTTQINDYLRMRNEPTSLLANEIVFITEYKGILYAFGDLAAPENADMDFHFSAGLVK